MSKNLSKDAARTANGGSLHPHCYVAVEEDGDEVFTIMPRGCTRWECQVSGKDRRLVNRKGFMVCPVCGGSYGRPQGRLFAPVSLLGRINDKMKPHQERVVTEKTELDTKREKLTAFIGGDMYRTLDKTEQSRLNRQLEAMTLYSNILGERIAAFAP